MTDTTKDPDDGASISARTGDTTGSANVGTARRRPRARSRRKTRSVPAADVPAANADVPAVGPGLDPGVGPGADARRLDRLAARRTSVPQVTFPDLLPVSQRRDELAAAIAAHQVVIVAGETGSGKTTQLPKICLELGRGVAGMIGHTQPRRIAARTVAERIAEELGVNLGEQVGYQVRFTGKVSDSTLVKVMTDGILLAETLHDRLLRAYDTLIIDEAHERSLNIDFLLGYVKRILPRRPDLRVVVTSATIDPQRFSRHFDRAPIIEVSGRTYPVEIRYRPLVEETTDTDEPEIVRDQVQAICDAVDELHAEGPGDVLVFLSGEREIRDTADALRRQNLANTEILPLYARLTAEEQHRVFAPGAARRIVLATNVAETSLTVPGITYVVDPGTARISRYSQRLKVQRLPIEPVSQASANQRAGRCGRTADGVCLRLYAESDYQSRPAFTEPEILRTNLASVILRMAALDLGDIEAFPFLEAPDRRSINDGVALLNELGAFDPAAKNSRRRLTDLGRQLAQLPLDPRLGRMILAARDNGCLREVIVIAAALTIADPRERPLDKQAQADQAHARFRDPDSDFITYLNLWTYLNEQQRQLSSNQFRRLCKAEYLNYLRVREWQDLDSQLRQIVRGMDFTLNKEAASPYQIHVSLLAGLLSHLGMRDVDKPDYLGARGARFAVAPGSALHRRSTRWVMVAELVETSRLWGRIAARIEPEWAERLAGHVVKRTYSEPHWDSKQGSAMAFERVTLYGLPLAVGRKVHYGRIDPGLSRELFIRHALVEGDWDTTHPFFERNRALLDEVEELEHRARRRDILVDDATLYNFYDRRIGHDVVSARHFDTWWRRQRHRDPDLLTFTKAMLVASTGTTVDATDYPDLWPLDQGQLALTYQFEPGAGSDGVTVHIPLAMLTQVRAEPFDWQVPGLRQELATALIRSLPKALRRNFVPVPDFAADFVTHVTPPVPGEIATALMRDALAEHLRRRTGVAVARSDWDLSKVPDHLRITFRIEDEHGAVAAEGKDLAELRARLAPAAREALAAATEDVEQTGITEWNPGTLAKVVRRRRSGQPVTAYPALVDESTSVAVRVFETEAEQARAMRAGTRRLLLLAVPSPVPYLSKRLSTQVKLGLTRYPYSNVPDLLEDCVSCAADAIIEREGGPAWDDAGYDKLLDAVRAGLVDATVEVVTIVDKVVAAAHVARDALAAPAPAALAPSIEDMRAQLVGLISPGFVTATGWRHLIDLPRYLKAISVRLERLPANPARDRQWLAEIADVRTEYDELLSSLGTAPRDEAITEIRWMIEELRVSFFAQELRTPYPVSTTRIFRAIDQVRP